MWFFFSDGIPAVCFPEETPPQLGGQDTAQTMKVPLSQHCPQGVSPDPKSSSIPSAGSQSPAQPCLGTVPPRTPNPCRAQSLGLAVPPPGEGLKDTTRSHTPAIGPCAVARGDTNTETTPGTSKEIESHSLSAPAAPGHGTAPHQ